MIRMHTRTRRRLAVVVTHLHTARRRVIGGPLFVAIACGLSLLTHSDSVSAAERQKKVLVLYPVRGDSQLAIIGNRDLPTIIEAGLNERIDYYSEYVYSSRFRGPSRTA